MFPWKYQNWPLLRFLADFLYIWDCIQTCDYFSWVIAHNRMVGYWPWQISALSVCTCVCVWSTGNFTGHNLVWVSQTNRSIHIIVLCSACFSICVLERIWEECLSVQCEVMSHSAGAHLLSSFTGITLQGFIRAEEAQLYSCVKRLRKSFE